MDPEEDVTMLNMSMTGMSMNNNNLDDNIDMDMDMEMLLDTLEDSVGTGITTDSRRKKLQLSSNTNNSVRSRGSSLNNLDRTDSLNMANESDALEYFDELFSSGSGDNMALMPPPPMQAPIQKDWKTGDNIGDATMFPAPQFSLSSSLTVPPSPATLSVPSSFPSTDNTAFKNTYQTQTKHTKQQTEQHARKKTVPILSSNNMAAPRAPPRTKPKDTTNMLVGQEEANKVFAQEMPASAADYDTIQGVTVQFQNAFFDRYWRNKRHNVQCFPSDSEYGDYCNWLMAPKESKGDLSVPRPVQIQIDRTNEASHSYDQLQCIARIIPLADRRKTCVPGNILPNSFTGLSSFESGGGYSIAVRNTDHRNLYDITPKLWKYNGELPKKRKQGMDYRLCLEVLILGRATAAATSSGGLVCLGCCASPAFELGSTRTLMRLKVKYKESQRGPNSISARNPPTKRTATTKKKNLNSNDAGGMVEDDKRQKQNGSLKIPTTLDNDISL